MVCKRLTPLVSSVRTREPPTRWARGVKEGPNGKVRQVSHGKDVKVREMRTAETLLNIIQDRGKRKLPLDDVYRQLYNPDFSLRSYAKMYKNDGAMTPGTTEETVDGMSLNKIDQVIEIIRCERWKWPPVRRVLIDKPQGGKRPLGIPDWSPKVVAQKMKIPRLSRYSPFYLGSLLWVAPHLTVVGRHCEANGDPSIHL